MAVVVPNKRQWSMPDIIMRVCSLNEVFAPSPSTTTFPFDLPPRSPVDSLFLPFLQNVSTCSLSTPGLRLRDVDLP